MASSASKFAFLFCVALLQVAAGQNVPEIFVAPTAMHVDYGSTAYMACVAYIGTESQSSIVTTMNWYDPHSRLLSNNSDGSTTVSTIQTTQSGQVFIKSILKICNFTTDDFGSYTCRVTNFYGQTENSWIVSIVRLPIAPQLLTSPTDLTTTAGNTVYMTCSAYGYPYPAIIWRRDGQVVQSNDIATIDTRVTNYNGVNVSVSTLKICGADSDYVGSYTCTANVRDIGQVNSRAWRLDVTPVPIISNAPDDHRINYGVTAYMTCTAYIGTMGQGADRLASTLSWTGPGNQALANRTDGTVTVYAERDIRNGQVFMKSYLKICNFTQSNSGQYSCRVSNPNGQDSKTWSASLPYAVALPQLVAVPSTQTVRESNSIYMTCAAYGYPFPDVTWYKNGQVVAGTDGGLIAINNNIVNYNGAQVVQSDLKICPSSVEDSGDYTCSFSTRDFGTVSSQPATLTVVPVPEIVIAPQSQDVNYGVTFFMSCAAIVGNTAQNAHQLSTTVTWRGPNNQALTNSTTGVTVFTETVTSPGGDVIIGSVIQVCGFTQALAGMYSCEVSNANGQDIKMWNNTLPRDPVAPTVVASPTTQTVSEGNSVLMACAGYGYPSPKVTWYRNGQPLDPNLSGRVTITTRIAYYSGAPVSESTMKICGAAEEDHGSYYCSFSSAFGNTVNSNTWQVNVNPAPTIVVAPQNHKVDVSNTVFMSCAAYVGTQNQNADSLTTSFTWYGPDSTAISDSAQVQVLTDTSIQSGRVFVRSILKICGFSQNDAGRYTCRVSNANGNENRTWTATFPQTPVTPQLAAISSYDSVTFGNTVYMACAMYGYPQPQITWTKDNAALPASATVTTTYVSVNNINITRSVVRICGFQSTSTGLYQCIGTNMLGNNIGFIQVSPEAPEIIASPSSRKVNYAHTIYMSCIAYIGRMNRSVDQLQTTFSWWDRNNNQLSNSSDGSVSVFTDSFRQNGLVFMRSILKICNFSQSDTGQHSCRAMNSNGQGSANWNLTFLRSPLPPIFLVTPSASPVTAANGRTVYMECAAYGFPFPQITWTFNGQVINPNSTFYRVDIDTGVVNYLGAQVSQSILKICGAGEEDMGSYVCTASTSVFGNPISSSPVILGITPVPTIVIAPTDQDITFGKTTLMTCVAFIGLTTQNAASIPTSFSWWNPNSQQLANNSDNSVSIYTRTQTRSGRVFTESILKICNVSHALEGMYSCQVSNNNGIEMRSWNVSLPQQPFAPTIVAFPVPQSTRRLGFSVLMACAAYGYPPPVISFNQRGQPIDQADLDGPFRVKNSVQTYVGGVDVALGVLEVCAFDYDDIGTYTCTATARNVGQVTSGSWNVDVLPAPFLVVSPMSQNVSYDTVLRMTCTALLGQTSDAQPATITWYDGNGMLMDSTSPGVTITSSMFTNTTNNLVYVMSNAVVSDIGLQHFGELSCTANNSLGWDTARWNITSSQEYIPPQGISVSNNNQIVSCGSPITLNCTVWGYPPPDVIWTLNGTNIDTSNQMDTLGLNYTNSLLVINKFNRPNSGVYVCTASNDVGNAKTDPVVLTLDTEVVLETAAPSITSSVRTNSDLAVVEFKPVASTTGQEFEVSYYSVANSSGTPDLSQIARDGSVQSAQTQITLTGLQTCSSYWVTVAVVNSCGVRRSGQSDPKLVGLYDVRNLDLLVTLPSKPCTTWITESANTKIADITRRLQLAASTCGITIPCIVSSQWQCPNDDPQKARFSTQLVGDEQTPTASIATCINKWFTDNGGSMNLQIGNATYAVGLVPVGQSGPQVNATAVGIAVVVVIVVIVGIVVAVIIAIVMFKGRNNRKPAKKEKLQETQEDFGEVYSRHSFAVVENPLFADQEEGEDTSYAGGAEGYEYDSGTLERKEDLGADDEDIDDKSFI